MRRSRLSRSLGLGLFALSCMLTTGCKFFENVQFGFAAGLGGIPATIVGNFLADLLFGAADGTAP